MDKFQLLAYMLCIVSALSKQNAVTFKLPTQGNSHRAVTLHTPGQHSVKMLSRDLHALKHGRENHRVNRGQRFNLVNLARPGPRFNGLTFQLHGPRHSSLWIAAIILH
jgi:hypothetical protein